MQSPNKNYLGHWDLPESGELTVTIKSAGWEKVKNPITIKSEAKRVVRFNEKVKPWICNQTNAQSIVKSTGIKFMEDAGGCEITLYIDSIKDRITKEELDCIRVKQYNPFNQKVLKELFEIKNDLLDTKMLERINQIINNNESASYKKAIEHLNKL
jgi:hypothetical protein